MDSCWCRGRGRHCEPRVTATLLQPWGQHPPTQPQHATEAETRRTDTLKKAKQNQKNAGLSAGALGTLRAHPPRSALHTGKLRPHSPTVPCSGPLNPRSLVPVLGHLFLTSYDSSAGSANSELHRVRQVTKGVPWAWRAAWRAGAHLQGAPSCEEPGSHSSPTCPATHLPAGTGTLLLPDLLTFFVGESRDSDFSVKCLDSSMLVIKTMFFKSSVGPRKASHLQI